MVTIAFHKDMTLEKWASKPVSWQVLSIASEMGRAEASLKSRLWEPFRASLERTLELIDLTVEANLSSGEFVREMLRFREVLAAVYADPASPADTGEFRALTKVLLTLEPGAYNLLGVTF
jgi:hypothetical protein